MVAYSQRKMLHGKAEIDETCIGGKNWWQWKGSLHKGKQIAVGIRQRGGELRFFHAKDARSGTLAKYIHEALSEDVDIPYTHDWKACRSAAKIIRKKGSHNTIRHSLHIYANEETNSNTVESTFLLLKRGISGSWNRVSTKRLQAYCTEMAFRLNCRWNPNLFLDTLRHMVTSPGSDI